jgi:hypothetical protein
MIYRSGIGSIQTYIGFKVGDSVGESPLLLGNTDSYGLSEPNDMVCR